MYAGGSTVILGQKLEPAVGNRVIGIGQFDGQVCPIFGRFPTTLILPRHRQFRRDLEDNRAIRETRRRTPLTGTCSSSSGGTRTMRKCEPGKAATSYHYSQHDNKA